MSSRESAPGRHAGNEFVQPNDRAVHDNTQRAAESMRDEYIKSLHETALRPTSAAQQKQLHDNYGVDVESKNGKYEYHLKANGKDTTLFSTDATPGGLREADAELKQMVQDKEHELAGKYSVSFAKEGEKFKQDLQTKEFITARNPSLTELAAVEAALKHSDPSFKREGADKLQINFAAKATDNIGGRANYEQPDSSHPDKAELNIWPKAKNSPPTEQDVVGPHSHENTSLEEIITHELSHANEEHAGGIGPDANAQYKRDAGWVPLHQPPDEKTDWALRGKDGYLYTYTVLNNSRGQPEERWARLEGNGTYDSKGNYNGRYLDRNGKPFISAADVPQIQDMKSYQQHEKILAQTQTISNNEARDRAVVKPATTYFPNPEEMMAEGVSRYRLSESSRAELLKSSPQMYEAAKAQDQREIDKFNGPGKKVRLPNGQLVDANDQSRRTIDDFEKTNR